MDRFPYAGQFFSILCAIIWAIAVILFRKSGEKVHPLALNLFKNSLAVILFIPTILLFGEKLLFPASPHEYLVLLLSGAFGIAFGDTLYFVSLNALGAGLTGIVVCMGSPFIIFFSILLLHEHFTVLQALGAGLIVAAILFSSLEKNRDRVNHSRILKGIAFGVLSAAASAAAVVLMKPILTVSPLVWATEVRLVGGFIILAVIFLAYPDRGKTFRTMFETRTWPYMVSSSILGAYVAMLIWIAGMKYTFASTSSALNQTSTIFIFIFAGIFLKEPVNIRRIASIIAAFAGVLLVIFCGVK
jgi:drug/metabolite transporter (DMT)-like permease